MSFAPTPCSLYLPSLVALGALLVGSCAREQEPAQSGYMPGQAQYGGQYGQAPGYAATGGSAYSAGGAPAYGAPGYAGTAASSVGGQPAATPGTPAGGAAHAIDPAAASILQPALNELAKAHVVAGSKPLGSPIAGNFQTGQSLETTIQLQPPKCYSVVATSLPPVTDLNAQLVAATPLPNFPLVLAIDDGSGPTAVVGKKPNCYKPLIPAPAKVVIQVVAGSGLAAAQVYEK